MTRARTFPSNLACKVTMAVTGLLMAAFLLIHMLGNLKAFLDPAGFDEYARWLRVALEPVLPHGLLLWMFRIVLGASIIIHVWCSTVLWRRSRVARGPRRAKLRWQSFLARNMLVTGIVIAGFVVFHILDLTTGHAAAPGFVETTASTANAYNNMVASFSRPWAGGIYLATMVLLWSHLAHGLWTAVNDLGVTGRRGRAFLAAVAGIWALAILAGNASLPIAVWMGWLS